MVIFKDDHSHTDRGTRLVCMKNENKSLCHTFDSRNQTSCVHNRRIIIKIDWRTSRRMCVQDDQTAGLADCGVLQTTTLHSLYAFALMSLVADDNCDYRIHAFPCMVLSNACDISAVANEIQHVDCHRNGRRFSIPFLIDSMITQPASRLSHTCDS